MNKLNNRGFLGVVVGVFFVLLFLAMFLVSFKPNNEVVSGIVYNTSYSHLFTGNTHFSVRASEATYVSEENRSSYCLPPNSPYLPLIKKAAEDKRVKVVVTADKYFALQAPWTCKNNVRVTEVK